MREKINFYELAVRLEKNVSTVYQWHAKGWLPSPHKVGGRWFFFVDEIDAWENSGCPRNESTQPETAWQEKTTEV